MKKQCIIFVLLCYYLASYAQQVTYCPFDMSGINGYPVFFSMPSHDVMWAGVFSGGNTTVYGYTTNAGASFTIDSIPAPGYSITSLFAFGEDTAWAGLTDLVGANGGAIYKTTDGGGNWIKKTSTEYTGSGAYFDWICFFSPDSGVVFGDPVGGVYEIYTTSNGGETWDPVASANIPPPLSGEFGLTSFYSTIGNKVWAGTNKGRIYYSSDKGYHWSVVTVHSGLSMMNISMSDELHGVAHQVESETAYLTSDGGATWTPKPLSPSVNFEYISAAKGRPGAYIIKSVTDGLLATSNNFGSWVLIDNSHPMNHNNMVMYDATIGWTQSGYSHSDSAIIKITAVPYEIQTPEFPIRNLNIYPNPVTADGALIFFDLDETADIDIDIFDLAGKWIQSQRDEGQKGENAVCINLCSLSNGVYFLNINTGSLSSYIKLIKNTGR